MVQKLEKSCSGRLTEALLTRYIKLGVTQLAIGLIAVIIAGDNYPTATFIDGTDKKILIARESLEGLSLRRGKVIATKTKVARIQISTNNVNYTSTIS